MVKSAMQVETKLLSQKDAELSRLIFDLIKRSTSQSVIKDFLESKKLPKTADNWDDYYSRRIFPALEDGTISVAELRALLSRAEESGKQHIFLFKCDPVRAKAMIEPTRVIRVSSENGLQSLLDEPKDLDLPASPEIVDIRCEKILEPDIGGTLTIKVVETRETRAFFRERRDPDSGNLLKEYTVDKKRAVNIARLHENGLLELRISSRDNTSKYIDDVRTLFYKISKFILTSEFTKVSLDRAKTTLVKNRSTVSGVRYSQSSAKNDYGCVMQIATSTQDESLTSDAGSMAAITEFLDQDGFVTGANVYFEIPNTVRKQELHVLLSGEVNEFAIPVACTPEEYTFVLGKILSINSQVPARGPSFTAAPTAPAQTA